ncbi:LuxR C-terminal-related transcriptional regulator [Micromonospora sp. NPDC048830]|uniref:LuxR C-terminal-related transcriptional regulator n=1 Tax=Micromonospora sp. NPDC048830 TaxID=3364257 RepID=UPI00371569BC
MGATVRLGRESAARARADEARRLADAERLRVAREVHDVVGHGLAAIHMRAEIALHLLAKRPEQAEAALAAISRTSKEAFLTKDTRPAELLRAVRLVAEGEALLSPSVTRRVVREFATRPARVPRPHPRLGTLTDREREVVGLVGEGLSNAEIAERLVVSPATARTHVSRAMVKLGARDRAQLVVFAYQSGLVDG